MNIQLFPEKCIACGLCQTISAAFDYDDEGIVRFADSEELRASLPAHHALIEAAKFCPTKAILIEKEN